jgi:WhiB family redox-sensing transcriptional regulator
MATVGATARIGGIPGEAADAGRAVGDLLDAVDNEFGTRTPAVPVPLARTREVAIDDLLEVDVRGRRHGRAPGIDPSDDEAEVDDLDVDDLEAVDDGEDDDADTAPDATDVGALLLLAARSRDLDPFWKDRALCAETDPEAFFPEKGGSTREAKRVCSVCDVRAECLEAALSNDERFGIWGGLSERERRRLKKRVG